MTAYKSGSRHQVIRNMVSSAIRDQETLIDAFSHLNDRDSQKAISDAKAWIEDFRRLGETLAPKQESSIIKSE